MAIIAVQFRASDGAAVRRLVWSKLQHSFRCEVYLMVEPDCALILRRPAPPQGKLRMIVGKGTDILVLGLSAVFAVQVGVAVSAMAARHLGQPRPAPPLVTARSPRKLSGKP